MEGRALQGWTVKLKAKALPKDIVITFQMGSIDSESNDEKPVHIVTLSNFLIGEYEVTQAEWCAVMGANPSNFKGDELPVESVTWFDAVDFCNRKSRQEGLSPCYTISGENISCDFRANG